MGAGAEYLDKASGKSAERPAFRRMLDAASRKDFDLVLFWSLDRFSREGVLGTLQHLERLAQYAWATEALRNRTWTVAASFATRC